jgi:hypothetical protein
MKTIRTYLKLLTVCCLFVALTACEFESTNNLKGVPDQGLFIYLEANRHENGDVAQIAAAVFRDGEPLNAVGGDVFKASTNTSEVLLTEAGYYTGSYYSSLPISDVDQDVTLTIVHEPVLAREDRWYPVDVINVDPGPSELVGNSATVTFPPPVIITTVQTTTPYTSVSDTIDFRWVNAAEGDTMHIRAATTCDNGLNVSTYGTEVALGGDDGIEAITMNNFIFDTAEEFPAITFIADVGLGMLQQLLNDLSAGKADPNFFARQLPANPIESDCEIRLFLFRQRDGIFDNAFDSGSVKGSTSAEFTIYYSPN